MQLIQEAIRAALRTAVTRLEYDLVTVTGDNERQSLGVQAVIQARNAARWGEGQLAARAYAVASGCFIGQSANEEVANGPDGYQAERVRTLEEARGPEGPRRLLLGEGS